MSGSETIIAISAMLCALQLMQPDYPNYPLSTGRIPQVLFRDLAPEEKMLTSRGAGAAALYVPAEQMEDGYPLIIAPTWDLLVHESCHHIQASTGLPFLETQCEGVQLRSLTCTYADGVEASWPLPRFLNQ